MLINYLFYSLEKGLLSLESETAAPAMEDWVKCRISLVKGQDVEIGIVSKHLVVKTNDKVFWKSNKELGLNYAVKETENTGAVYYQVFSLNCELRFVVQLPKQSEQKFRQEFKEHLIFTSTSSNFENLEFFDQGLVVKNYMIKLSERSLYGREPFYAKIFEKDTITSENLETAVYNSIKHFLRLPGGIKLNLVQMFETEKQFLIVMEKSKDLISVEFFIKNQNMSTTGEHELINQIIVLNLIEIVSEMEKMNICFPILSPKHILISKIVIKNSLLLQNADFFTRHSILESSRSTRDDRDKDNQFGNVLKYFINFKDFKIGKIHDINFEMYKQNKHLINLKLINTEFLFNFEETFRTNDRIIKTDLGTLSLVSNLFLNLSRNLNTINIGFVFLYMLTKLNYCIESKHIKNENKAHFCVNFSLNIIKNCSSKNKMIIRMLFEDSSLDSIYSKIIEKMIENSKIDKIANHEDQSFVFTSEENIDESPPTRKDRFRTRENSELIINDPPLIETRESHIVSEEVSQNLTMIQNVSFEHEPFENKDMRIFGSISCKLMSNLRRFNNVLSINK